MKARFGEERLAFAVEEERFLQAGETLKSLVQACRTYAQSMGYSGADQYYTKVWSEKPWRFAVHLAQDFACEEVQVPMRSELAAVVTRIRTLADQCLEFWNRMSDGDRGALARAMPGPAAAANRTSNA